jgi:hypothetical protein
LFRHYREPRPRRLRPQCRGELPARRQEGEAGAEAEAQAEAAVEERWSPPIPQRKTAMR